MVPSPQAGVLRRAAGHSVKAARHRQCIQLGQAHLPLLRMCAAGEAIGDDARLLEDFLEHEVAVPALLRGLHIPLDGLRFGLTGLRSSSRSIS